MKDSAKTENGPGTEIDKRPNSELAPPQERNQSLVRNLVHWAVIHTVSSVRDMPVLEEPHIDLSGQNLPSQVVSALEYAFKKFEYAVEPTRRGFAAWLRLFFALLFPFACIGAALFGVSFALLKLAHVVQRMYDISDLVIQVLTKVIIGMGLALAVVFLAYILYAVMQMLRKKPINVPVPEFVVSKTPKE